MVSPERSIDHWVLPRLRRLRQLGWTDMTYPGVTHTRFEHSLGVTQAGHPGFLFHWNRSKAVSTTCRGHRVALMTHAGLEEFDNLTMPFVTSQTEGRSSTFVPPVDIGASRNQ